MMKMITLEITKILKKWANYFKEHKYDNLYRSKTNKLGFDPFKFDSIDFEKMLISFEIIFLSPKKLNNL